MSCVRVFSPFFYLSSSHFLLFTPVIVALSFFFLVFLFSSGCRLHRCLASRTNSLGFFFSVFFRFPCSHCVIMSIPLVFLYVSLLYPWILFFYHSLSFRVLILPWFRSIQLSGEHLPFVCLWLLSICLFIHSFIHSFAVLTTVLVRSDPISSPLIQGLLSSSSSIDTDVSNG